MALFAALLLLTIAAEARGDSVDNSSSSPAPASLVEPVAPAMTLAMPVISPSSSASISGNVAEGVNWGGVINQSLKFLALQHSFRVLTEPGTRRGLNQIPRGYLNSVSNLRGWSDGDPFYVNYVGHPMQGSTAAYIWAQNDRRFRDVTFGRDARYWKSRLRATAFSAVYSFQFELGPMSEASVGQIQAHYPQQGFADMVVTPVVGLGWMVAEDAMDKYVIGWFERRTTNGYTRALIRSGLNPTRTLANVLAGRVPWARDDRIGVFTETQEHFLDRSAPRGRTEPEVNPPPGVAPFEFSATSTYRHFMGPAGSCRGGGASAAFRMAPEWQLVADVSGCGLAGLKENFSGNSLSFLVGPRWAPRASGRWSPYVQVLAGGQRLTVDETFPEKKLTVERAAPPKADLPPAYPEYMQQTETAGVSVVAGAGLDVKLNAAMALRLASVDFTHSWVNNLAGNRYRSELHFTSGIILRFGTW